MNILIITYNIKNINIINYDPVLYLVESVSVNVKKKLMSKHVSIIKDSNINSELIKQVEKYYNHFDRIILIDNLYEYYIEEISENIKNDDWIITGNICPEQWVKKQFIPSYFSLNKLMFNCNNLNETILNFMKPSQVKNISFTYFSRIIYEYYDKVYSIPCSGITKIENYENLLI